jgi:hypothetical protein
VNVGDPHHDTHDNDEYAKRDKEKQHVPLPLPGEISFARRHRIDGAVMMTILFHAPHGRLDRLGFGWGWRVWIKSLPDSRHFLGNNPLLLGKFSPHIFQRIRIISAPEHEAGVDARQTARDLLMSNE